MLKLTGIVLAVSLALCASAVRAQQAFDTPEAAVAAMVALVEADDMVGFEKLFGPEYVAFREGQLADPALAAARKQNFFRALREYRSLWPVSEDKRVLYVGAEGWPFPMPIVRNDGKWSFDGAAGVEELKNRIIGANELNAIAVLDAYVVAQKAYAAEDRNGDGVLEHARRFGSSPGKKDGLYWETAVADEEQSPLGPLLAAAEAKLGGRRDGEPFLGYRFRILEAQGAGAKSGPFEYVVNGRMVAGFGAVAWPAEYGETGVMTFVVNQDGTVYQHDFGKETLAKVDAITRFDPGPGWLAVDDSRLFDEDAKQAANATSEASH